jgi:hypothetical protein
MRLRIFTTALLVVGLTCMPGIAGAQEPDSTVVAGLDFDPNSLNLKSSGRWVTCYIELPEGHEPDSVDVSSVSLCDSLPAVEHPTSVCDYDEDEIDELMVKFDRAAVCAMLAPGDSVEVWVTGAVGEAEFSGVDTIRVFWPPYGPQGQLEQYMARYRERVRIHQNCPNPFNPKTTIGFTLPEAGEVRMDVYDAAGHLVATLVDRYMEAGEHRAEWNGVSSTGAALGSGVYFCTVTAGQFSDTRKMLLLK